MRTTTNGLVESGTIADAEAAGDTIAGLELEFETIRDFEEAYPGDTIESDHR